MFLVLEKVQQFKAKLSLEQSYQLAVFTIIIVILVMALIAILKPVSSVQMQRIEYLRLQHTHPESQQVATQLIEQKEVSVGQYLKLMHVYQYETQRAQQLPPVLSEDK